VRWWSAWAAWCARRDAFFVEVWAGAVLSGLMSRFWQRMRRWPVMNVEGPAFVEKTLAGAEQLPVARIAVYEYLPGTVHLRKSEVSSWRAGSTMLICLRSAPRELEDLERPAQSLILLRRRRQVPGSDRSR